MVTNIQIQQENNKYVTSFRILTGKMDSPHIDSIAGMVFTVRMGTMDDYIISELILNDTYKLQNAKSILGYDPNTIVDLGAHIGGFTRLADMLYPESNIYAFEANKENFLLLRQNTMDCLYSKNLKIRNTIVCGDTPPSGFYEDRELKLTAHAGEVLNTGGIRVLYEKDKTSDLEYTTLERIIDENKLSSIDFLKMDIEGSEYEVLKYAKKVGILNKIKFLACELHVNPTRGRDFEPFMGYLENFSYIKIKHDIAKNHRMIFAKQ